MKNLLKYCLLTASLVCLPAVKSEAHESTVPAIRHELATLPHYNVFDWLDGESRSDGSVILRGDVTDPSTRADAESRVRSVEGVTNVTNEIRVLPLSPSDNALRIALYRAIYNWNSPLFRYSTQVVPPIHIVVDNGRADLKGVVANPTDSEIAFMKARQVAGLFEVRNDLQVE